MTVEHDHSEVPPLTLGWRIQMALQHGGLKHADLMQHFDVSRETVSRWCRDKGVPPKRHVLNQIALMCGVPAHWLETGENPPVTPEPPTADQSVVSFPVKVTALHPFSHRSAALPAAS